MTQINSYLTFNGNCREAMTFYKDCIGGELTLQTIGDSPMSEQMPAQMKESIMHSTLIKNGNVLIMGSDMCDNPLVRGNASSILINCSSEDEIRSLYEKLSTDGKPTHPVEKTFWGALFGNLVDKYGNQWMLNFQDNN